MRRFEKKQLLELADAMKSANGMLDNLYRSGNLDVFQEVLVNEQNAAISIGTKLDETMDIVHLLEEYCELLWNASNVENQIQLQDYIEILDEKIVQIKTVLQEIPVRLEVVFLPYKASMWDCMETVWMAAAADPDCDAYVMPIPYYDRNPDGSAGELHYEADLMPKNVPVTSFREYNLEERRPDVIYIHNPYDEYNKVTSVHPNFYCSELKKCTDMLVYIPYFLLGEHLAESHSIMLPAYKYCDKIVLQGEAMAEDIDPAVPREKFVIAGSPKAERMVWMEKHKEQLPIPQEWKNKCKNKKVVFYNVSITGLINDRDEALDKIEEVFDILEKRQDIILLYRPHPLMEATLTSMYPELLGRYQSLVERVKRMENAIYDTNPDAGLSVVVADAYIGESTSSIVDLFKVVQKPLFFLTKEKYYQPTLDEMLSERTMDACRVGDDVWFVTQRLHMLCKCNINTMSMEIVEEIPGSEWENYGNIISYKDKLILVPYQESNALCIYDIVKKSFRKDYFKNEFVDAYFSRVVRYEKYLFLIPINYSAIVRYDVESGEYEYYYECIKDAYSLMPCADEGNPFVWGVDTYKEELYISSAKCNIVITFNMETGKHFITRVGKEGNKYRCLVADETYCWIILCNGSNIVRWNRVTGDVTEFSEYPEGFVSGKVPFKNIIDMGKELYLIPFYAKQICKLNKAKGEICFVQLDSVSSGTSAEVKCCSKTSVFCDFARKISEREILISSLYDNSFIVLDVEEENSKKIPMKNSVYLEQEARRERQNLYLLSENSRMPLEKYLEYFSQKLLDANRKRGVLKTVVSTEIPVGKKIHKDIKKAIL